MSDSATANQASASSGKGVLVRKTLMRFGIFAVGAPTFLCAVSGHWDWAMAWILAGALAVGGFVNTMILVTLNPDMVRERQRGTVGSKSWDRVVRTFMAVFSLAALIVAAFDKRYEWPFHFSLGVQIGGFGALAFGDLILVWAMSVNRFFARVVRIQAERGHTPIMAGPYRFIRHPGYIGFSTLAAAALIILGSPWAFIPAAGSLALLVVRTALEDKTLHKELDGYADYASRVRYRLVPGIW